MVLSLREESCEWAVELFSRVVIVNKVFRVTSTVCGKFSRGSRTAECTEVSTRISDLGSYRLLHCIAYIYVILRLRPLPPLALAGWLAYLCN